MQGALCAALHIHAGRPLSGSTVPNRGKKKEGAGREGRGRGRKREGEGEGSVGEREEEGEGEPVPERREGWSCGEKRRGLKGKTKKRE